MNNFVGACFRDDLARLKFLRHCGVLKTSQDRPDQKGAGALPFSETGAANFKNYDVSKFDYTGHCLPFGLLRSVNVGGYPIQIMQNKKYVALHAGQIAGHADPLPRQPRR